MNPEVMSMTAPAAHMEVQRNIFTLKRKTVKGFHFISLHKIIYIMSGTSVCLHITKIISAVL